MFKIEAWRKYLCCLCWTSGAGLNEVSVSRFSHGGKREWPSHWALAAFAVKDNKIFSGLNQKQQNILFHFILISTTCFGTVPFIAYLCSRHKSYRIELTDNVIILVGFSRNWHSCSPWWYCTCTESFRRYAFYFVYIQGVPGGMCETSGECSLC